MFFNKRLTLLRSTKAITTSGAVDEVQTVAGTNLPAMIQDHTITSLPPPPEFHRDSGIVYPREGRCWIARQAIDDIRINDYLVDPAQNNRKFRITAVIDDAGVSHHWLLRIIDYV